MAIWQLSLYPRAWLCPVLPSGNFGWRQNEPQNTSDLDLRELGFEVQGGGWVYQQTSSITTTIIISWNTKILD